jgi:glycogen operon protein
VEWFGDSRSLVCLLGAVPPEHSHSPPNHHVMTLIHAGTDSRHFVLPPAARAIDWFLFLNTAAESPCDIYPSLDGPSPTSGVVTMEARSMAVYVARDRSLDGSPYGGLRES